jgi:hypothetical protein
MLVSASSFPGVSVVDRETGLGSIRSAISVLITDAEFHPVVGDVLDLGANTGGLKVKPMINRRVGRGLCQIPPLGTKRPDGFEEQDSRQRQRREDAHLSAMAVCGEPVTSGKRHRTVVDVPEVEGRILKEECLQKWKHKLSGAIVFRGRTNDGRVLVRRRRRLNLNANVGVNVGGTQPYFGRSPVSPGQVSPVLKAEAFATVQFSK